MIAGTLILVFGTMMTSISTQYYQYILAQGILVGVGIGTVYVYAFLVRGIPAHDGCSFYPSLSAISTYFQRYRSTALGVALAGSGVGGVAWPIMYQQLFARVGFAWTVRISGLEVSPPISTPAPARGSLKPVWLWTAAQYAS